MSISKSRSWQASRCSYCSPPCFELRSGGAFLSPDNLRGILGLLPEVGLVSVGVTILMICGEFDLSVGSTFALAPMATSLIIIAGVPLVPAVVIGLVIAAAIGFVNGFITLNFAIPSFITTLGMLFIVRSLTVVISGGFPPLLPDDLATGVFTQFVGPGGLFRGSFIWFVAISIAASAMMTRSNLGNWIRATGGNLEGARAMGVPARRVKLFCFVLCSGAGRIRRRSCRCFGCIRRCPPSATDSSCKPSPRRSWEERR